MAKRRKRGGSIALLGGLAGGLLAGAVAGGVAGLLLAPKAGRVTRRYVGKKGQRAYRNVREKLGRGEPGA